ncbi:MAG: hypothetical protein HY360_09315 [Verrucomicrobia bacterium]|nr:hypothetical protein [Verrucomicrobiota bacterium]
MRIWVAQFYERVPSLAGNLLLVACSTMLMIRANQLNALSPIDIQPPGPGSVHHPFDAAGFSTGLARLTMTPLWNNNAHRFFIAPVMIAPDTGEALPETLEKIVAMS